MCPHIASVSFRSSSSSRIRASRLGFLAFVSLGSLSLLGACNTTPLDVVYAVDVAPIADADAGGATDAVGGGGSSSGGSGGMPAVDPCLVVGPGRYTLRSQANLLCLGQGAPTSVFGNPGFLLDFNTDCQAAARTWELAATTIPNVFSLRNGSPPGFVMDVKQAQIADTTPVITFGENGYDNQRFEVRARNAFTSELRPQHHPQSCVAVAGTSAQIKTCDPNDSSQAWQLQRSDCK